MTAIDLPDVNVWLALADENHEQHGRARQYWESESAWQLAFTRVSMLGFVRLLTNRVVMRNQPFTVTEAWAAYRAFRALPEVIWLGEPENIAARVDEHLTGWAGAGVLSPLQWTDGHLAALALATDCRLVSFDGDFRRYAELTFFRLE